MGAGAGDAPGCTLAAKWDNRPGFAGAGFAMTGFGATGFRGAIGFAAGQGMTLPSRFLQTLVGGGAPCALA